MNDTISITCPACDGARTVTKRHPSGDPQLETEIGCPHPDCHGGVIEVEASEVERLIKAAHEYAVATAVFGVSNTAVTPKFIELRHALIGIGVDA